MYKTAVLVMTVQLVLFLGEPFQNNHAAYGQWRLGQRLANRRAETLAAHNHAQAVPQNPAQVYAQQSLRSGVEATLDVVDPNLTRLGTAYDVVQGTNEFIHRGFLGNPYTAGQVMAGVLSRPLAAAGVGPQTGLLLPLAESKTNLDMALHDRAGAELKAGIAQQNLQMYQITGDPQHLARAAQAARPDPTYSQIMSAETGKPFIVQPQPGMPGQRPGTAVGDLAGGWRTVVQKEPFKSDATSPIGKAGDWVKWKFDPANISSRSSFDRTFHSPDGTTRIQMQRHQTGLGYEPGKTTRYEHTRVEFRGQRVESWGGARSGFSGNTGGGFGRSTFGGSNFSRPTFSSPSTIRH